MDKKELLKRYAAGQRNFCGIEIRTPLCPMVVFKLIPSAIAHRSELELT
ncbi:MAG: hypothetical protein RMX68_009850 [Aulosira sp. ZfuVER01]|nr:hypothetical protein [Aulosira sp. ZfuVER01]MDZ7998021.1 hypothetical protein [Aulosira sp. DedVER01a]MDZ8050415.1 hypothetical protein [Aulosira sp. ZfuCHP01]